MNNLRDWILESCKKFRKSKYGKLQWFWKNEEARISIRWKIMGLRTREEKRTEKVKFWTQYSTNLIGYKFKGTYCEEV